MRTCLSRVSTLTGHQLPSGSMSGGRSYTHVSQPLYKLEQVNAAATKRKSGGWFIPAALAVIGLGVSTFSTQRLLSSNSPVKMLSSPSSATTPKN